jgi:hypothetical protein
LVAAADASKTVRELILLFTIYKAEVCTVSTAAEEERREKTERAEPEPSLARTSEIARDSTVPQTILFYRAQWLDGAADCDEAKEVYYCVRCQLSAVGLMVIGRLSLLLHQRVLLLLSECRSL